MAVPYAGNHFGEFETQREAGNILRGIYVGRKLNNKKRTILEPRKNENFDLEFWINLCTISKGKVFIVPSRAYCSNAESSGITGGVIIHVHLLNYAHT